MYVIIIIMKVITEKFPVRAQVSNQAWRLDQEQCRKSVDQVGTGKGRCQEQVRGERGSPRGMARYEGNGKWPGHPQGRGLRWRHPSDRQEWRT